MPDSYDLAVIGAGIAGMSIAAMMAGTGKRVVLTDPAGAAGGCMGTVERDGFRFSGGPDLTYGLEAGGALENLFNALGMAPSGPCHGATYQVALPDRRITVAPDTRVTMEELRREFPAEIDRIARLYREARAMALNCSKSRIASALVRWRSARAWFRPYSLSPQATAFFDVQSRFFFGRPVTGLSLAELVLLLDSSPCSLPGGFGHMAERLQALISGRSGRLFLNEPWPELHVQGRRVSEIGTGQERITVGSAVLNTPQEPRRRTVFLGIREEVLPVGMERIVLCLPDYGRPDEFFTLSFSKAGEAAPQGMRSGTALFFGSGNHDVLLDTLRERIGDVIPFLTDFLVSFGEHDGDARRFALPEGIGRKTAGRAVASPLLSTTVRNLFLLDDSPSALQRAVSAAQTLASRLG